jgi:hypothetical protein
MAQVFRDEARSLLRAGDTAVLAQFLTKTILDFFKTVLKEHVEELFNIQLEDTSMSYYDVISDLTENPEALESLYQTAVKAGDQKVFQEAIDQH